MDKKIIALSEKQLGRKFDHFLIYKIKKFFANYRPEAYIACFSSNKDTLSQWRAYADDGYGVSIGFDIDTMRKISERQLKCEPVSYFEDTQILAATQILDKYIPSEKFNITTCNDLRSKMQSNYIHPSTASNLEIAARFREEINSLTTKNINDRKRFGYERLNNIADCIRELIPLSHSFKNPAFYEENEYRLKYLPTLDNLRNQDVSFLSPLRHRHSDKRIIPYFSFKFPNYKNLIKEIVLGPRCKLDKKIVINLLKNNSYSQVTILRSRASYR